ncbi:MAG: 5-oxoprolinase subunit PxpB [Gluconacetobacter sp.]|uniref:5-oxoprolinase subunit PxpB n=1 Tax=Gluconacetobacter dulcium TaxID=2729096 RepID=UPI00287B6569|nr:5-oxoprolinase subunit PxpB [Gluconacetobacter dulcium]
METCQPADRLRKRISPAGAGALLLDAATQAYDQMTQDHVLTVARALAGHRGIIDVVPGVNNLLVLFDAVTVEHAQVAALLDTLWELPVASSLTGREITASVTYGGAFAEDLAMIAEAADLSIDATIALHESGRYCVAAIGAMPGFAYLTGLDPRLILPRRASPRLQVERGAVIVGGSHASIMPCTAPTGWHILGHTDLILFDPDRAEACLLRPGDIVRFQRAQ